MKDEANPLFSGILEEAKAKAGRILEEARKEESSILEEAESRARAEAESERRSYQARLEAVALKEESARHNVDRIAELRSLDNANAVVMKTVRAALERKKESPEFSDVLSAWIAEGAIGLDRSEAKVSFSRHVKDGEAMLRRAEAMVEELTGAKVSLSLDTDHILGDGVVVSSLDGKVSYNNQLEVRVRRYQRDIRRIVQEENARENSRNS